jgi:DnaK suppressor protein
VNEKAAKTSESTSSKSRSAGKVAESKPAKAEKVEVVKAPPKPQLDADLLEEIREQLLRKKAELGANVNNELDDMREAAEGHHLADMDDLGGDAHDEETQYKIMEIESAELGQIDMALDRMTAGTFGYCEVCEQPINPERLRALPFANLCIECKRQQEANEG